MTRAPVSSPALARKRVAAGVLAGLALLAWWRDEARAAEASAPVALSAAAVARPVTASAIAASPAGARVAMAAPAIDPRPVLTVCAEPDNLPYSNARGEGFENRVAELLADDLGMRVSYVWAVQRRGYLRRGLNAGRCDVVMSAPVGLQGLAATRPWYASSYVFVTRRDGPLPPESYDDPALRDLRIGLQAIGAEGGNTPPAMSLARRGLTAHVRGYPMWGREGEVDPQGRIVDAVASGEVDVAIVWGPFAGWFAKRHGDRLVVTPVAADPLEPGQRPDFAITLGVRRGDDDRLQQLQAALDRHQAEIGRLLRDYGLPAVAQPVTKEPEGK